MTLVKKKKHRKKKATIFIIEPGIGLVYLFFISISSPWWAMKWYNRKTQKLVFMEAVAGT